jgi:hypothetical protein
MIKMTGLFFTVVLAGIFFPSGNKFNHTVEKVSAREPFEVVDTLKLSSGFGKVVINKHFTSNKNSVMPTNEKDIFPSICQILRDTTQTVNYYGLYISSNLETLTVKSSSATDTSRVRIRLLMR